MNNPQLSDIIRDYFWKNNFYSYRLKTAEIAEKLLENYVQTANPSNKRNLRLDKFWSEIHSFGKEREIIAIDLGGTNLNLFKIQVEKDKKIQITDHTSNSFYEKKIYTPETLFSDLRKELDKFVPSSKERENLTSIVFIFSYPLEQVVREDGYVDAICTYFAKTRKSEGIVGLQVGISFQKYLRENGYPQVSISVTNDTPIYCLANKGYSLMHGTSFDAGMNIIVGTGMNISTGYDEHELEGATGLRIINTECGDFKGNILSKFDEIFNKQNDTPDRYLVEKMVSGAWQNKIFKVILKDLEENGIISKDIFKDMNYQLLDAEKIETFIKEGELSKLQHEVIQFVWKEINKRGGAICGILIAGMLSQLQKVLKKEHIKVVIMETGSVIAKSLGFREAMIDMVDNELGRYKLDEKISYTFYTDDEQPALGAAIFDAFFIQ